MNDEKIKALLDSLPDEQREKAMACKSKEELFALLGELGVELSDAQLDGGVGGVKEGPRHYNQRIEGAKPIV